jgi:hypothetical protein
MMQPGFVSNFSSPIQRRVTPLGELIAVGDGGNIMGNRGCLHGEKAQIGRIQERRPWNICRLNSGRRHQPDIYSNQYTEMYFWDEATALSAGHRPCYECSRAKYLAFIKAWKIGNSDLVGSAGWKISALDSRLAFDRVTETGAKQIYREKIDTLPSGVFISLNIDGASYAVLIYDNKLLLWSPSGYRSSRLKPKNIEVDVITPRSTVNALKAGYLPSIELPAYSLMPVDYYELFDDSPGTSSKKLRDKEINELFLKNYGS